jgi:hypothetical protein
VRSVSQRFGLLYFLYGEVIGGLRRWSFLVVMADLDVYDVENDGARAAKKLPRTLYGKFDSSDPVQAAAVHRRMFASLNATAKKCFATSSCWRRDRCSALYTPFLVHADHQRGM